MLVLVLPPVSSRVSGFPVTSPCLWGKLQNLSFCRVANCENCRKSRTKCWFFCIHVSCLESLVFLWRRRVYGGSWKTCPFRMFPSRLSCCFAWQTWHFWHSNLFDDVNKIAKLEEVSHEMLFFLHPRVLSRVSRFPVASPCLCGKSQNLSFSNVSTQVVDNVSKMSKLDEVSHEMFGFLHPRVSFRVSGFSVASLCLWGKLEHVSFAKVSNFECTGLLVQWGLRFVKIWQECDYVESGKLLCGLIQISHSVVYIFLVLCRQTFRLCSIARERQAFTVHDRGVYRDIARRWFSNVRDRYPSKCRMHGSVADSGMKFDSDVVEDLCL